MKNTQKWRQKHPIFFWTLIIFSFLLALAISFYLYIAYLLPLPDSFQSLENLPTTKIYDRHGILLYEILQPESGKVTPVPLNKIPKDFINATLASEDINFYNHPGVDFLAIARAIFLNIREQRVVSGGSTITQQLVRNLLGSKPQRDFADKILEAMYAVRLTHMYSKEQILELYMNRIYYGNLSYGAESAALDYFGKHIYDLDLAESTLLAGLPQSPSSYNPFVYFEKAKKRQKYVLDQMVKNGFITQEAMDVSLVENLNFRANKYNMKAPHFVHYVIAQLEEQYGEDAVMRGGLIVKTSLDYNLQLSAENTISRQISRLKKNNVNNAALIALDVPTGQILSWVGSADYFNSEIHGAIDMLTALRQPGSSIKPLNYLLAFEKGYTPATILYDIATQFSTDAGPYAPKNYDLSYHGPVRVRTALASSYNIPAVKTLEFNGVNDFISFLAKLGIQTLDAPPNFYGLALTLGGGEVRVYDMANAFNVLANYGVKFESSAILEVEDSTGKKIFEWNQPEKHYVLGPHGKEHAYQIIDILKDPLARIPGFGEGSVLEISHEAAVKTGTTRNFKDNWTIGFTPQLLTAVWVGNADASSMENVSGVDGAAPIWSEFMETALVSSPHLSFERPPGLVDVEICALSGKLPTEYCSEKLYEIFVRGTEPKKPDDYYRLFWIDKQTGHIILDACKKKYSGLQLEQKVLVAYPPELQKWAGQNGLPIPPIEPCREALDYSEDSSSDYPTDKAELILIDNPNKNDEYLLDSSLPLKDQRIPFRVTAPLETLRVRFLVNQELVQEVKDRPYSFLWLPKTGKHQLTVEAELADGSIIKSNAVDFIVR